MDPASWLRPALSGIPVSLVIPKSASALPPDLSAVVTTLSPCRDELEQSAVRTALEQNVPVYAIEEVPGGRRSEGWDEEPDHLVRKVMRLITVAPDSTDKGYPVTPDSIVGPLHFGRYAGVDWKAMANMARQKLAISPGEHVVWCLCHPEPETPAWLILLGAAVNAIARGAAPTRVTMVVTRHRRELVNPGKDKYRAQAYQYALQHIASHGVHVIDNSEEFGRAMQDNPFAVQRQFAPRLFASYTEMLALCKFQGVVVTGFATAGLLDAPYLGVPSELFLDEADELGYHYGAHLKREPMGLPAKELRRTLRVDDLSSRLGRLLFGSSFRGPCLENIKKEFPWPKGNPPEMAAQLILNDLNEIDAPRD